MNTLGLICLISSVILMLGNFSGSFGTFVRIIALTLPFTFSIKDGFLRGVTIAIALFTIILSRSFIAVGCLMITLIFIFWEHRAKILCAAMLAFVALLSIKDILVAFLWDIYGRTMLTKFALSHYHNILFGEGTNYFFFVRKVYKHRTILDIHNDILQIFIEQGALFGTGFLILLLLPFLWIKSRVVMAGYSCLVFQCFVDFPLNRVSTMILSMTIILLAYWEFIKRSGENGTTERFYLEGYNL